MTNPVTVSLVPTSTPGGVAPASNPLGSQRPQGAPLASRQDTVSSTSSSTPSLGERIRQIWDRFIEIVCYVFSLAWLCNLFGESSSSQTPSSQAQGADPATDSNPSEEASRSSSATAAGGQPLQTVVVHSTFATAPTDISQLPLSPLQPPVLSQWPPAPPAAAVPLTPPVSQPSSATPPSATSAPGAEQHALQSQPPRSGVIPAFISRALGRPTSPTALAPRTVASTTAPTGGGANPVPPGAPPLQVAAAAAAPTPPITAGAPTPPVAAAAAAPTPSTTAGAPTPPVAAAAATPSTTTAATATPPRGNS